MKKYFFLSILSISTVLILSHSSYSQGLAVNTDGSTPDPSAMLDVKSTNKGMLVPRVTSTASITSPVTGLLIYQTNAPAGFYYYSGASWLLLQNSGAVVSSANGGAGSINGILEANGSGTVSAASTTGSGNVVLATSPTLVTPSLGTPSSLVGTNISGTAANLTAGNVTTNANLTGDVTSSGNATTIANTATGGNHIITALGSATSGTIPTARLGSNSTGGATVFLNANGAFATPVAAASNIFPATISNTINATTSTYFVTDGSSFTLPAATTSGQVLILLDISPGSGFTGSGFSVTRTSTDTITDDINTGTTGLTSLSGQYLLRLVSDGSHHWYIF